MKLILLIASPLVILLIYIIVNNLIKKYGKLRSRSNHILSTILSTFLIYLILFLATTYMYFGYKHQLDFNQEVWINKPEKRYLMLENLLESKQLITKTTNQVKSTLGKPIIENDTVLIYKILEIGKLDFYENKLILYHNNRTISRMDLKKRKLH